MIAIWISAHRNLFLAIAGLSLWLFANYWYLRTDIRRQRAARSPHKWSVDMETKQTIGSRTKDLH